MAYYDALITKWATLTPGTTAAKLVQINAATATGASVAMVVPTYKVYNLIDPTEFVALTAANQQLVRDILGMGTVDASAGTSVRARMVAIFPSGTTRTALNALAATYDSPQVSWWSSAGYSSPVSSADLAAAGGLS